MIEWNEYLSMLLSQKTNLDDIVLSLDGGRTVSTVPPIIKASVLMLDSMIAHQGKYNILVFPEKSQSIFSFTIMQLMHNISDGKIGSEYDPDAFQTGEKLKIRNAVVEYIGMEIRDNKKCIMIKLADVDKFSAPVDMLPMFQRTTTKRRLSKKKQFMEVKRIALQSLQSVEAGNSDLTTISEYKTHMTSSVFNMTSLVAVKNQISDCQLCRKKISDFLLLGQTDYEGNIHNIGAGQLSGIPAIVFASDLYAISASIQNGHPIQSVIIDASNINLLLDQLDTLDELMKLNVPVICTTDIANSFDLEQLSNRGFNIWRWDASSLTGDLYDVTPLSSDRKIKYCAQQDLKYIKVNGHKISESIKRLSQHRRETQEQSAQIMKMFSKLNDLSFSALRETVPFREPDCEYARQTLGECAIALDKEKPYISETAYRDYSSVIVDLEQIYSPEYKLLKQQAIQDVIREHRHKNMCIIIPEKSNKPRVQEFWQSWVLRSRAFINISVFFPVEYYSTSCSQFDLVIIVGWLKRAIMRKIIFSYNTRQYIVLLYDHENRWKNYDSRKWSNAFKRSNNREIIEQSFSTSNIYVSTTRFQEKQSDDFSDTVDEDELEEIELILRENKYRQYVSGGNKNIKDSVDAIPVNFVGGYIAFYRTGHKLLSATQIIMRDMDKIELVLPAQLKSGDFIVVRETDKDIIKEMADLILNNNQKNNLRELASKWKEVLKIELLFTTANELYQRMVDAGCKKGFQTVKGWIEDDDIIAPQQKQDLQLIADVTNSEVLHALMDDIFDAAHEVRNAHVQAGKILSGQLKLKLGEELKNFGDIDPFNFWEPVEMDVEGIGTVKVLKIIDVGTSVVVDSSDTNRLIEE